jgi:hypothetical protein
MWSALHELGPGRACWTFAQFAEMDFASVATLQRGIYGVVNVRCGRTCFFAFALFWA